MVNIRTIIISVLLLLTFTATSPANRNDDFTIVVNPEEGAISNRWVFVVDTSDSLNGIFDLAIKSLNFITMQNTDDWKFSVIVFNNCGCEKWFTIVDETPGRRGETIWAPTTPQYLSQASKWISNPQQHGVNSYAIGAIEKSLKLETEVLSVFWITDGGFTSSSDNKGFGEIKKLVEECQQWRRRRGLNQASITTVGIKNSHYSAWCRACSSNNPRFRHNYSLPDVYYANKGKKLSDARCQNFLRWIGERYRGGYICVSRGKLLEVSRNK